MTAAPNNLTNFFASVIISGVILIDLPAIYFARSQSPAFSASFLSSSAASFYSFLLSSSFAFISGGFPSNTQIGFIPFSIN